MPKKLKIALGVDHAGYAVKAALVKMLLSAGYEIIDCGTNSDESVDYPDFALRVSKHVVSGRSDRGILACGTGIGMAIAANKVPGVRAGVCWSVDVAKLASQHNWTNVLCLPARFVRVPLLKKIVRAWLNTPAEKGGRHERRIKKISQIEARP